MLEPEVVFANTLVLCELVRSDPTRHRDVHHRGAQVLPEREHIDSGLPQIGHRLPDLVVLFAHAQDDARLGDHPGIEPLHSAQVGDRAPVSAPGPHVGVQAFNGFEVVTQDGRLRIDDGLQCGLVALEIRDEHFDRAAGNSPFDGGDRFRVDTGAAVGQFVPIDARDHHVLQRHVRDRRGHAPRFVSIEHRRKTVGDTAVLARPRTDVAEDHEGGGTSLPALADVRTAGLFADGMKPLRAHHLLQPQVVGASGRADLQPRGLPRPNIDRLQSLVGPDLRGTLRLHDPGVFPGGRVAVRLLRRGLAHSILRPALSVCGRPHPPRHSIPTRKCPRRVR